MVSITGVSSMDVCFDMMYCSLSFIFYVCASGYECMFLFESPDDFFIVSPVFFMDFCWLFDVFSDGWLLFVFLVSMSVLLVFFIRFFLCFVLEFFVLFREKFSFFLVLTKSFWE